MDHKQILHHKAWMRQAITEMLSWESPLLKKETKTIGHKHFVTILQINGQIIAASESITPLNNDSIQFRWWDLVKLVFKGKALQVTYMNRATPFAENRLKGILSSIQLVPAKRLEDVQSKKTKSNYTNQKEHRTVN